MAIFKPIVKNDVYPAAVKTTLCGGKSDATETYWPTQTCTQTALP
jgi:hypothetical protein